ncbi:MAG: hypothetical protein WKG03_04710 [Telluria sp.]
MASWKTAMQRGLLSGTCASLVSSLALVATGQHETGSMAAPTNAISHWIWGDKAARRNAFSLRYTLVGYLIHHASSTFWAVLFERVMGRALDKKDVPTALAASVATSAVACFTDYQLTPRRLRPGFEQRLSRPALALVYGAFALGLAAGALVIRRQQPG